MTQKEQKQREHDAEVYMMGRKAERERLRKEIEKLSNDYLLHQCHQCIQTTKDPCIICHELSKYSKKVLALLNAPQKNKCPSGNWR